MKQEVKIDKILEIVRTKIGDEVSGLLGQTFTIAATKNRQISKADFFAAAREHLSFSRLIVSGAQQGEVYLFVNVKDAILLGGTLLMVPPQELEKRIRAAKLDEEAADAFGEIINIIAGIFNATFEQFHTSKLHFAKGSLESVDPHSVEADSPSPFPPRDFYLTEYLLELEGKKLGEMRILYPLEVLELGPTEQPAAAADAAAASPPQVLIVADDEEEARSLGATLQEDGQAFTVLSFQDAVKSVLAEKKVRGVFLVMREVNEQGFGTAIKIRASCGNSVPLVVAGPRWTRKAVLQAVKYGACDIVITPATAEEIREKIKVHMS